MIPIHSQRKEQREKTDCPDLLVMDEDDQDRLIEELQQENARQQAQLERIFGYLCHTGAVMSVLVGLVVELRQANNNRSMTVLSASWAHVFLSVLQHLNSFGLLKQKASLVSMVFRPLAINALLAVGGLFLARRRQNDDRLRLHYSLLACNILVVSMGLWLRRDQRLTQASINNLHSAKYHYKSL